MARRRRTHHVAHLLWIVPMTGWAASFATGIVATALDDSWEGDTLFLLFGMLPAPLVFALAWNAASVWLLVLAFFGAVGLIAKVLPLRVSIPMLAGGVLLGLSGLFIGMFVSFASVYHAPSYGLPEELYGRSWTDEIIIEYRRFGEYVVWHGGPVLYERVVTITCDYEDPETLPCYEIETGPGGDFLVTPEERFPLP